MRWATEPNPGRCVPASEANKAADQPVWPPPWPNIEVSAGPGSRSIRLKLPVMIPSASTPSRSSARVKLA